MARLSRRELLQASSLTFLSPARGQDGERFGFAFEREQAARDGLALLVLVPGQGSSDGILWADFFAHATPAQLADVALVRLTSSNLSALEADLPDGAEALSADTFLALYEPGQRRPRVLLRADLPPGCRRDFTLGPVFDAGAPPRGLAAALRAFLHPDLTTITRRLQALEASMASRSWNLPSHRLRRAGLRTRLAAELAPAPIQLRLLSSIGRQYETELRRRPVERARWGTWYAGPPITCGGPCGVGHVSMTSRRFLRFYLGGT